MRKNIIRVNYYRLFLHSALVALAASLLALLVKTGVEYAEEMALEQVSRWSYLALILPSVGITFIYFTRKYLFRGKENKGIKEIYRTISKRKDDLPLYKIPSHYINGFATVVFGGSTGIEVSTVVASAAVGASAYKNSNIANAYKTELICAGVAAGVTILFGSPVVGFLFATEVIAKRWSKTFLFSIAVAALIGWGFVWALSGKTLFTEPVVYWRYEAIPFMVLLSIIGGFAAAIFTRMVITTKKIFYEIDNNFIRVNLGAILVGIAIFFHPQLFGDSYHAIPELLDSIKTHPFSLNILLLLTVLVILKPLAASLTLGAGGDGGVFAPSIVTGAFLGMIVAVLSNQYLGTHLVVLNFAVIGAATMLSAAIHAPLTAAFLACSIVPGGYILFIPVLGATYLARYFSKFICSYTVYTYSK